MRCVHCGLRRNRHRPKSADHARLLAEHDYIARYESAAGDTAGFYSELLTEMGARSGDRLLDVGCSIGVGLKVASARGLHADGIEPDVAARRIAEKSGFQTWNSVDDLPAGALYDCFVMNHVLEHVVDPDKTLRRLRSHAAPGARLFIGVPSGAAAWARVQRDRWCFLALDEHVWYFDPKTLRSTATNAGWAVKTCRTSSRRYPGGPAGAAKNLGLAVADAIGLGETVNLVGVFLRSTGD